MFGFPALAAGSWISLCSFFVLLAIMGLRLTARFYRNPVNPI